MSIKLLTQARSTKLSLLGKYSPAKVGDVIRWNNFPDPRYPQPPDKARWFICLGKIIEYRIDSSIAFSVVVYIQTTPTQIQHYQPGESRGGLPYILFKAGEFGFEETWVLDFSMDIFSYQESDINKNASNIEIKGTLDKKKLINIYNEVNGSMRISKKAKKIIHDSLNMIGITGLKQPR